MGKTLTFSVRAPTSNNNKTPSGARYETLYACGAMKAPPSQVRQSRDACFFGMTRDEYKLCKCPCMNRHAEKLAGNTTT